MPNILLYVLDSLRPDHLSCYGYHRNTSPNIDSLAADGVLFESAFAQATWTRPSAGALFTGCYPPVHRAITMEDALSAGILTLPEWLKSQGYHTAAVSTIPQISAATGFSRGYDEFYEIGARDNFTASSSADAINHIAIPWLAKHYQSRFFLMLWAVDPHVPYFLPRSDFGFCRDTDSRINIRDLNSIKLARDARQIVDAYDSAVLFSDQQLGIILRKLRQLGIYDDTMIIITGDHGEVFDEHARAEQWSAPTLANLLSTLPRLNRSRLAGRVGWLGHLAVLPYEEVIRVPLIVKFPQGWKCGETVSSIVQLTDILPTIAEVLSCDPSSLPVQGSSVTSLIAGETLHERYSFSFSQKYPEAAAYVSARDARWKYIQVRYPSASRHRHTDRLVLTLFTLLERWMLGRELLFDLQENRSERRNVIHSYPEVCARFRRTLADWDKANAAFTHKDQSIELDQVVVRRLRDLGYL